MQSDQDGKYAHLSVLGSGWPLAKTAAPPALVRCVLTLCALLCGSLCPLAPGDTEQVGSAWMGTLWPHSCRSVPLSALLGHSEPEACSSDVSSCCCLHLYLLFLWACCQILLQQVVPKPCPSAGHILQPVPGALWSQGSSQQRGHGCKGKEQHISGYSGGGERAFPCSPWETDGSSSSTSIPGRAAGSALRSLIKGKASSTSSCFYEKCWLLRAWEYSGTGLGK